MKQLLLTGFEPFSDIKNNPSETLVNDLYQELLHRADIRAQKIILPVDYQKADAVLKEIDWTKFDFIFQFGVAAKRSRVSLERVALNWIESQLPDNSGTHISEKKIDSSLPEALFNPLMLADINRELNVKFKDAVEVSLSAGAYLCNFVYFKTLTQTSRCLFVHIPTRLNFLGAEWSHESIQYRNHMKAIGIELVNRVL